MSRTQGLNVIPILYRAIIYRKGTEVKVQHWGIKECEYGIKFEKKGRINWRNTY